MGIQSEEWVHYPVHVDGLGSENVPPDSAASLKQQTHMHGSQWVCHNHGTLFSGNNILYYRRNIVILKYDGALEFKWNQTVSSTAMIFA